MSSPNVFTRARAGLLDSRYRIIALFVAYLFVLSLLTRVGLLLYHRAWRLDSFGEILASLGIGIAYDLVSVLWLVSIWVLVTTLLSDRWFRSRAWQRIQRGFLAVGVAFTLFVAIAEFFFFDEFDGRFNFVAVDYLVYPTEVVTNIWESYPIVPVVGVLLAIAVAVFLLSRRAMQRAASQPTPWKLRGIVVAGYALLLLALSAVMAPARAHISNDRALNEIATNGYYAFYQAFVGSDAPYAGLYATAPDSVVYPRLRTLLTDRGTDTTSFVPNSTVRHERAVAPARRLNVVVILEESLGAEFSGLLHPEGRKLTPNFDALSAEGTLFTNWYSTGNRTVRALEATTNGMPPLPGAPTVRRAASKNLYTLPNVLKANGYSTTFIYGGRAMFDNMAQYLTANGIDRVVDQSDMPKGAFTTAWGVADEFIFQKTVQQFDSLQASGQPFYALVLTVSNHPPYEYPTGRIAADPKKHWRVNAVQYADYALGKFMREAKQHAFYKNTLFVIMGDHGARVYGADEIPLHSYEVPMLMINPQAVTPGVRDSILGSHLDVPPTVLGALGMDYESKFFGHDVLHVDPSQGRALMNHNNEIAMMRGRDVAVLGLHQSETLYQYEPAHRQLEPVASPDSAGKQLLQDAVTYFSAADELYREGKLYFDVKK